MSAREMFEKLDFNERREIYKDNKITQIEYLNLPKGNWIIINQTNIEYVENHQKAEMPLKLLQAINKQVEELHWNNERN